MDTTTFDRLTRRLAGRPSRRGVVRGLTAALLGAGIVAAGPRQDAAAACVQPGSDRRCNDNNDCCGDNATCRNRRCECKRGFRVCRQDGKDRCVDRRNDPNHCGRCGKRCKSGQRCADGRCGNCVVEGRCGAGRPKCCAGYVCKAGRPDLGLGGCVPA